MPLNLTSLNPADLAGLDDETLLSVFRTVAAEIASRNNNAILALLDEFLAKEHLDGVTQVVFGTTDYDNGYFYRATNATFLDAHGARIHPDFDLYDDRLDETIQALDALLGSLTMDNDGCGDADTVTIDLAQRTVTHQ